MQFTHYIVHNYQYKINLKHNKAPLTHYLYQEMSQTEINVTLNVNFL